MVEISQIFDKHRQLKSINGQAHVADEIEIINNFRRIPLTVEFYADLCEAIVKNPDYLRN